MIDIDRLNIKYRDVYGSVGNFERLLAAGTTSGHHLIPGLKLQRHGQPATIWKARVLVPSLGGKNSGARYIYERLHFADDECAIALFVYVHQQGEKEEAIRKTVKERYNKFDLTPEGIRKLNRSNTRP